MLYITLNNSKKRLYINYRAIGRLLKGILITVLFIAIYLYTSNQDYLTLIN